jgi:hypothetical protein
MSKTKARCRESTEPASREQRDQDARPYGPRKNPLLFGVSVVLLAAWLIVLAILAMIS